MTDGWDERTDAMPGKRDERSFELDGFDLGGRAFGGAQSQRELDDASFEPLEPMQLDGRPTSMATPGQGDVVVFEPIPLGLATALSGMGLHVRAATTGVDVMSLAAASPPAVVVCAPAPDAERRRLLAAALRLRFPQVPVVYVSTHAGQAEAELGALREGARAVLPWPLPRAAETLLALAVYLDATLDVHDTNELTPVLPSPAITAASPPRAHEDAEIATVVTGKLLSSPPTKRMVPVKLETPLAVPLPVVVPPVSREQRTAPGLLPAARVGVEALRHRRGEIGELLAAVSPFLWSLEDAARWAHALGQAGDATAATHARTLSLLASILAQLQARVDDAGA